MKKSSNSLATLRGSIIAGGMVFGIAMIGMAVIGTVLSSNMVMAEGDSAVDEVTITVPVTCSIGGVVDTAHTISMQAGTYSGATGIGKTTLTTKCNDNNGFSIYAIGYTGDTDGTNTLVGASTNETINTGIYTTGANTSSWSMKVNKVTDATTSYNPNNMTILNGYDNWHLVPTDYAKVAEYKAVTGSSATDTTLGAKIETTYDAYVSVTQTADSYEGKVKYVLVHPNNAPAPQTSQGLCADADTCMQQQTATSLAQKLPNSGSTTTLYDSRDGKAYTVAKLADGKYWMTTNLDIAGGTALSADDTDVTSAYISSFSTSNNLTKSGNTIVLPASSTSGFDTANYSYVYNSGNKTSNCASPGCYSYYSWDAATLGSGRSISTDNTDAPYSICPKGWKLPSTYNGTNGTTDFRALMIAYGGSDTVQSYGTSTNPTGTVLYSGINSGTLPNFMLAGYYDYNSYHSGGNNGRYWSSTAYSNNTSRHLDFGSTYVYSASSNGGRYGGYSVRCLFSGQ